MSLDELLPLASYSLSTLDSRYDISTAERIVQKVADVA